MSPKFYSYLWIAFAVAAAGLWIAGLFTMLTLVVLGFVAFGFVFMGMMCVLPGAVSHPAVEKTKTSRVSARKTNGHIGVPIGLRPH